VSVEIATFARAGGCFFSQTNNCFSHNQDRHMLHKTLVTFAAVVALGCMPLATNAFAAPGHPGGRGSGSHATAGHAAGYSHGPHGAGYARGGRGARYGGGYYGGGPIYDSCAGYAYGPGNGCPGYGVPFVGGVINGILGGY
jgi:hypothetical protein